MLRNTGLLRAVFRPVAALIITVVLLLPGMALASPPAQTGDDMSRMGMKSGADFEINWMSMMIEHHQDAIDMANLALNQGMHQEIKDISATIIRDQQKEIDDMTLWLQQWHNTKPITGMMHGGMDMDMTTRLRAMSGDAFDREFLTLMHEHHRGAVMMSQMVPTRAIHDELKALAQSIITTQEAEIQQFMGWAMAWYNLDLMAQGNMGGMMGGRMMGNDMSGMMGGNQTVGMPRTGTPLSMISLAIWLSALLVIAGAIIIGNSSLKKRS